MPIGLSDQRFSLSSPFHVGGEGVQPFFEIRVTIAVVVPVRVLGNRQLQAGQGSDVQNSKLAGKPLGAGKVFRPPVLNSVRLSPDRTVGLGRRLHADTIDAHDAVVSVGR